MQRLMEVLRRDVTFFLLPPFCDAVEPLMWLITYPEESVRFWYQPIEDEL